GHTPARSDSRRLVELARAALSLSPSMRAAQGGAGVTRRNKARAGSSRHGTSGAGGTAPSPLPTSPTPDPAESNGGEGKGEDGSHDDMALLGGLQERGRRARAAARRTRAAVQRSGPR
ncbi:unnamed protein product, partial [Urochloa humidicola]